MSQYYKDAEDLYKIYGYFLDRVLKDDKIGAKMRKAGIIIKFMYTDPDAEITIDLKNPPTKPGYYGTYYLGPCDLKEDVWSKQPADHSHRFWFGLENPIAGIAKGIIKQGGKVTAMLKLLPVIKPAFQMFPIALSQLITYLIFFNAFSFSFAWDSSNGMISTGLVLSPLAAASKFIMLYLTFLDISSRGQYI